MDVQTSEDHETIARRRAIRAGTDERVTRTTLAAPWTIGNRPAARIRRQNRERVLTLKPISV